MAVSLTTAVAIVLLFGGLFWVVLFTTRPIAGFVIFNFLRGRFFTLLRTFFWHFVARKCRFRNEKHSEKQKRCYAEVVEHTVNKASNGFFCSSDLKLIKKLFHSPIYLSFHRKMLL